MAGDGSSGIGPDLARGFLPAPASRVGTARVEDAAGGTVERGRRLAGEGEPRSPAGRVSGGDGGEEGLRVGVERPPEDLGGGTGLDDLPEVKDRHPIRDMTDHGKIM
jgi:hypothetical protein